MTVPTQKASEWRHTSGMCLIIRKDPTRRAATRQWQSIPGDLASSVAAEKICKIADFDKATFAGGRRLLQIQFKW